VLILRQKNLQQKNLVKILRLIKNTATIFLYSENIMASTLTQRQQQILALIRRHLSESGFPPTRAEIAAELGFRSVNAAEDHLQALAKKGVIELTPGTSRGIRLKNHHAPQQLHFPAEDFSQLPLALSLPLVGRVAAGSPILASEHVENRLQCDSALFSGKPDYLLKVRGMSMRDVGILDGDLLAVQRQNEAHNGQIIVARLGDEVTVKRYRKTGSKIELLPENREFQPIKIDAEYTDFSIEGLAVGLIRSGIH
jgi:repressor LexA